MQLHYLTPAKHLLTNHLRSLENLINSLETENRCRLKRNQHPLTYTEAYSLLTQILGGDVLNCCQSANIHYDIFSSATFEGQLISDDRNVGNRGRGKRGRGFQRGRGNRGNNSSGRGRGSNRNFERKINPLWAYCRDFNSEGGCSTQNCPKKHSCSQRLAEGVICNQKTHGRTTHDAQY